MATSELLIFDPEELSEGRTQLDVTSWVDVEGINWGEAEVEAYRAQGEIGERVIDHRLPNRNIVAPMVLKEVGGTAFATIRSYIQAKAALWQREGGIVKRVLDSGGTVYADIVADGLTLGGGWAQAHKDTDTDAEIRLESLPDFYEPEREVTTATETAATEIIKVIEDPGGDMPSRVRLVVNEDDAEDQRGLIWAFRSRHYSEASTAKTAYEAEELDPLDTAIEAALSGASGGTVVQHGTISTSWTPVLGGQIGGTAYPTHVGNYRFYARVYSTSGTAAQCRLVYDVGDLVNPDESNAAVTVPAASQFYVADLGEVRLDEPPVGTHRWHWQVQAKGEEGDEDFKVDRVWIVNTDEGHGVLAAPTSVVPGGFTTYKARDEFNHSAGDLTGKTLPAGGTWAEAGDLAGFTLNTTDKTAKRTEISDAAGVSGGHFALAGTSTYTDILVRCDFVADAPDAGLSTGPIARYSNTSKYVLAYRVEVEGEDQLLITKVTEAGVGEAITYSPWPVGLGADVWYWIALMVRSNGGVIAMAGPQGSTKPTVTVVGFDTDLATGGDYASGKVGALDQSTTSNPITREIDNFAAWVPTPDAVIFANQSAQLTTDGMFRLDSGGTAYGPVSRVTGDIPRLPAGGLENRDVELFLKASRGDLDELPDNGIDDLSVEVFSSRSWLTVPGTI